MFHLNSVVYLKNVQKNRLIVLDNPPVFASDLNNRVERENMDNYIVKHLENIKRNNVKVISLPNKECKQI